MSGSARRGENSFRLSILCVESITLSRLPLILPVCVCVGGGGGGWVGGWLRERECVCVTHIPA